MKDQSAVTGSRFRVWQAYTAVVLTTLILLTPGPVIDMLKAMLSLPVMPPSDSDFPTDKLVHFLLFAVTAGFVTRARYKNMSWPLIFVLLLMFAGLTECLQILVPGRSGDVYDFLADALGVAAGMSAGLWWCNRK